MVWQLAGPHRPSRRDPGWLRVAERVDDRAQARSPRRRTGREGAGVRESHRRRDGHPRGTAVRAGKTKRAQTPGSDESTLGSGYGEGWLRRLTAYCWKHKGLSIVAFGASLVATLVTTAIPLIQADIIDNAILKHTQPVWAGATLLIVAAVLR